MILENVFQSALRSLDGIIQWTWTTSWQASVLVLMVWAMQQIGRGRLAPRWQYALWMLVVARLLMPWTPASPWSVFNVQRLLVESTPGGATDSSFPASAASDRLTLSQPNATSAAMPAGSKPHEHAGALEVYPYWPRLLQGLWLAGLIGILTSALLRQRLLIKRLRCLAPITSHPVLSLLDRCRKELGVRQPVRVFELDHWPSPAVFGGRRPCLLLPAGMAQDLGKGPLRQVFLHELVHVQRHDFLMNWLFILIQAWHWFNPLVWLALRRVRAARELVCDARVLQGLNASERTQYGQTLLHLAQTAARPGLCPGLIPVLNRPSELKRRIHLIARPTPGTWLGAATAMTLMIATILFTFTSKSIPAASPAAAPTVLPTEAPLPAANPIPSRASLERSIRVLEEETAQVRERLQKKREEYDALRLAAVGTSADHKESLARIHAKARADYEQMRALVQDQEQLSKAEWGHAAVNAQSFLNAPDASVLSLLEQKSQAEQALARLQASMSSGHPEVQGALKLRETIDRQLDQRLEGSLLGLKTSLRAQKAALDEFEQTLRASQTAERRADAALLTKVRSELETLQRYEEDLHLRLQQFRMDVQLLDETTNQAR